MPSSKSRSLLVFAAGVLLALVPQAHAQAQAPAAQRGAKGNYPLSSVADRVVVGTVKQRRAADGKRMTYVLLDADGNVEAYLDPTSAADVKSFEGQRVMAMVLRRNSPRAAVPVYRVEHMSRLGSDRREDEVEEDEDLDATEELVMEADESPEDLEEPELLVSQASFAQPLGPAAPVGGAYPAPGGHGEQPWYPEACGPVPCGNPHFIWGDAQYLLWWTEGMRLPPLVTTSPVGTPREQAGVLGQPGTQILLGNEDVLDEYRNGLRGRLGIWFDRENHWGVQGEWLGLEDLSESFTFTSESNGQPILARPFFNVNPRNPFTMAFDPPAREDSELVSFPNVLRGTITVDTMTQIYSAGAALRMNVACDPVRACLGADFTRVDLLTGYRYFHFEDSIHITENLASLGTPVPSTFSVFDTFETSNDFHGVDVGFTSHTQWRRLSLDLLVRTALGNVQQEVTIQGGTTTTVAGAGTDVATGGLLALPSNIGTYSRDRFAVIPELGATFGFELFPNWRVTAGYTFLYWHPVVRAGNQIDLDVNPDQLPPPIMPMAGASRPAFAFQESGYWAQGVNVGLQGRW